MDKIASKAPIANVADYIDSLTRPPLQQQPVVTKNEVPARRMRDKFRVAAPDVKGIEEQSRTG